MEIADGIGRSVAVYAGYVRLRILRDSRRAYLCETNSLRQGGTTMSKGFHGTALALLVATLALGPVAVAQTAALDGRAFIADAGMKGKDVDEKGDVITFTGGNFHSRR